MKWEYKVEALLGKGDDKLNKLGLDGWELVAVHVLLGMPHAYLKRKKD